MKKTLLFAGAALLLIGGIYYAVPFKKSPAKQLPTYFSYSAEEQQSLQGLSSGKTIESADLFAWDEKAFDLVRQNTAISGFDAETSKIYAYLAVAQRDFAFISHNKTGKFPGTIGPLSKEVLCIFFPNNCADISDGENDNYSAAITKLVLTKVKTRIAEDNAGLKSYTIKTGKEYWDGPQPSIGIKNGSNKGWFITSGSQFRAPEPSAFGSAEFKNQVLLTKNTLADISSAERQAVVFWAGGPGTKTPPGQILELADNYMEEKNIELQKVLLVRSVLTMAVADAVTSVFDSKYTYWVRRPFMMDSSIVSIMPTPNHPSYPAGHSTLSAAGAVVLDYYFPEAKEMWDAKANEAAMSRVWGGIHYPMDNESGVIMGRKVGQAAIEALSSHEN